MLCISTHGCSNTPIDWQSDYTKAVAKLLSANGLITISWRKVPYVSLWRSIQFSLTVALRNRIQHRHYNKSGIISFVLIIMHGKHKEPDTGHLISLYFNLDQLPTWSCISQVLLCDSGSHYKWQHRVSMSSLLKSTINCKIELMLYFSVCVSVTDRMPHSVRAFHSTVEICIFIMQW